MSREQFHREKMKRLVHYICWKCENPSILGSTKLNKVLWFSDVLAYLNWGRSITGETYIKRQFGPVPKHILPILDELRDEQAIVIRDSAYYGNPKRDFIALSKPDLGEFSPDEISLIDSTIERVCRRHTAKSISEITHDDIWKMAALGEEIPVSAMFSCRVGEVTPEDLSWAQQELKDRAAR